MLRHPKINRRGWIATWLQHRRRKRANGLLPAPVLRTQYPDLLVWNWSLANPSKWNVWQSTNGGVSYFLVGDYWAYGALRQFAPDGGSELYFVVGVDESGNEVTGRSNPARPDDALLPAPVLRAAYPTMMAWDWTPSNPYRWNVWMSLNGGGSYTLIEDYWTAGSNRTFAPDGGSELYFIVGVDANGVEITERSNSVRPDDAILPAPVLSAVYPGAVVWTWDLANPDCWRVFVDGSQYDDLGGESRSFTPEDAGASVVIVGLDGDGNEITERSNAVVAGSFTSPTFHLAGAEAPERLRWYGGQNDPSSTVTIDYYNTQDECWENVVEEQAYSAGFILRTASGTNYRIRQVTPNGYAFGNEATCIW